MATDVELGGNHDFEQVLFQNQDIAALCQDQNLISSSCVSDNSHSYGYTYILPGEDSESMDIVSPSSHSSSSSNGSTETHHEVYFTETEVQEAAQESEGCAMELGTFFSSCEHNPSENSDSGSYMLPLPTEVAQFPMYRVPIDGDPSDISQEEFRYASYSWYVHPAAPNESSNVLSIQEHPTTMPNTSDKGSQLLANSMQSFMHYPYGILPMESVVFQDTEFLMPEEHFLTGNQEAFVAEAVDCNDLTVNSDARCKGDPVKLVKQEVDESNQNGCTGEILNPDNNLNNNLSSLTVVKKEVEVSSEQNDNWNMDLNDYISSNPLPFTVLEPAAAIPAETENNSSSSILNVCANDSVPFNVVKEEVIDNVNGSRTSENVSQCSFASFIPLPCNLSQMFEFPPRNELYPTISVERYDGQGQDISYVLANSESQQATELAIADEEETDPLYFVENHSESETNESLPSSNSKRRNRKTSMKKGSYGKGKTTEKPRKERKKCNGQRRRGSADSNTSVTVKRGIDVNSLRYIVGPRLRYLSAVLEVTGVKYMTDYLPYEIMRRFHPTNTYRTIFKAIQPPTNPCTMALNNIFPEEPDWNELKHLTESQEEASFEAENGTQQQRMYFKSPLGFDLNGGNLLSIPKDSELDGTPTYSPDTISSVGSADLNVILDLESLATSCPNTEFRDNTLPLVIRLREPKCCGLVYDTGKLIVVGAQSFEEFRKAARRFARMVQKSSSKVRLTNLTVHSYLGLAKLPFKINVTGLVQHESISKFAK
ncbi:unnamed protein product [Orchesella dallaii]|uniref:TATA box-binding protein-like protein 2 n=1 Tax=Orchesella dallaii TaxID=48710 RepID=A0ABP1Q997_9HEXA